MRFEYDIQVRVSVGEDNSEPRPESRGSIDWEGTAHALARHLLTRWHRNAVGQEAGLHATIRVHGEEPGRYARLDDPAPVSDAVAALETAIEERQVADAAVDVKDDQLTAAMRDATHYGGVSKDWVADRVKGLMSRPTALKRLRQP